MIGSQRFSLYFDVKAEQGGGGGGDGDGGGDGGVRDWSDKRGFPRVKRLHRMITFATMWPKRSEGESTSFLRVRILIRKDTACI